MTKIGDIVLNFVSTGQEVTIANIQRVKKELLELNTAQQMFNAALGATKMWAMAAGASTLAMIAPTLVVSKMVSTFDADLHRISALGGPEFASNIEAITKAVNEAMSTYGVEATDVTQAMIELVKTGYDYSTMMEMLNPILQLSIANQEDVATTAQLINTAYRLWGEEGGYAISDMADKMHMAATMSKMDVGELGEMFRYAGSSAAIAGITYEEFLATAAALSQIGALLGESFGTFFQRLYIHGEDLEDVFGVDGIVENGVVNMTALVELLGKGAKDPELWAEAMDLWGVRAGRSMAQIAKAVSQYAPILEGINDSQGELSKASEEMQLSLEVAWGRIKAALMTPFQNAEVLDAFSAALNTLIGVLSSPAFTEGLQTFMLLSAQFIQNNGPALAGMLESVMKLLIDMSPVLISLANSFIGVLSIVSRIPAPLLTLGAIFFAFNSFMPGFINKLMLLTAWQAKTVTGFYMMVGGLALFTGGITMMAMATDDMTRIIGALVAGIGAVTTALWVMAAARAAAMPETLGLAVGGAMGILTLAQLFSSTNFGSTATEDYSKYLKNYGGSSATNTYNTITDNSTVILNGVGNSNDVLEQFLADNTEDFG